jgi:hypothetical protein
MTMCSLEFCFKYKMEEMRGNQILIQDVCEAH